MRKNNHVREPSNRSEFNGGKYQLSQSVAIIRIEDKNEDIITLLVILNIYKICPCQIYTPHLILKTGEGKEKRVKLSNVRTEIAISDPIVYLANYPSVKTIGISVTA